MALGDDRYSRHRILPEVGQEGQRRLERATGLILGCGALGSVHAQLLSRAGVGRLRLVDRDIVEQNNLQRQITFEEQDAAAGLPKAEAVAAAVGRINSGVAVEARVLDVSARNMEGLLDGVDLVMDGTDNFETRYLLNDACVKHDLPWVYGGVIGTAGMAMAMAPALGGPCLRCVFPSPPPPGQAPTCDTAGVLNAAAAMVGAQQAALGLRLLVNPGEAPPWRLLSFDPWHGDLHTTSLRRDPSCPCCGEGRYDYLSARSLSWTTTLCGRDSVQITPPGELGSSLQELAERLQEAGEVRLRGRVLQVSLGEQTLLVFPDGRTIVQGTSDEAVARGLYSKYIGG